MIPKKEEKVYATHNFPFAIKNCATITYWTFNLLEDFRYEN